MEIIKWDKEKKIVFLRDIDGTIYKAKVIEVVDNNLIVYVFNTNLTYKIPLYELETQLDKPGAKKTKETITAPISGRVVRVHVKVNDHVLKYEPLVTIESMKMENEIRAPFDLFVKSIHIAPGDLVEQDHLLLKITVGEKAE
jgi:biotin carboxyl carrier protein